jgi:hypothetical protein
LSVVDVEVNSLPFFEGNVFEVVRLRRLRG